MVNSRPRLFFCRRGRLLYILTCYTPNNNYLYDRNLVLFLRLRPGNQPVNDAEDKDAPQIDQFRLNAFMG